MSGAVRPGRVETITAHSNPRIKAIRALAQKKVRDREDRFLAEGEKLAHDALAGGWTIHTLLHAREADGDAPERTARLADLAAKVRARGGDILTVPPKLLAAVTRRDNPQAVVSVVGRRLTPVADLTPTAGETWLALDRVRDPGNLGTCLRTADALGIAGVVLVGDCTDPFSLEAVRATMGSLFHVRLSQVAAKGFEGLAHRFRAAGGRVLATHLEGAADLREADWGAGPVLAVMGNEQQGLDPALAPACDGFLRIPMAGQADSLNLAVATGITLFEARRAGLSGTGGGS